MASVTFIKKIKRPDQALVKDQLALLCELRDEWGIAKFAQYMIWIQTKLEVAVRNDAIIHSRLTPFVFNPIQNDIVKHIALRNICLKPRQVGLTTWFLLIRVLLPTLLDPGTNGFLISQNNEMAGKHFSMLKRAFKYIGAKEPGNDAANDFMISLHENLLHTRSSTKKELVLDQLDNYVMIGSAEVPESGQGITLHHICCSEVARWPGKPEETLANLKEALVMGGTLDLESTGNGAGGYFFEEFNRAEKGLSDLRAHFHPWWWEPNYKVELSLKQKQELQDDLDEDERKLKAQFQLSLEQVAFRRAKKLSLRHNFDEKYPEDSMSAFLTTGKAFFDNTIMRLRFRELQTFVPWGQKGNGVAVFLKKPIPGRVYVIGADPASGKQVGEGLDYSAAKVLDVDTGEEVASYINQLDPVGFGNDLVDLAKYYNNAMIGVERGTAADSGGDGGSVLMTIINDCAYGNIYQHRDYFKAKGENTRILLSPGLPMTSKTRPIALNRMKYMLENDPDKFMCIRTIKEMMVFVRNEKGRPEAQEGQHDDMVLATAIAHYVRGVILGYINPENKKERYGAKPFEYAEEEEMDDYGSQNEEAA